MRLLLVLLIAVVTSLTAFGQAPAQTPLFSPGQTYIVAWDCAPIFLALMASQAAGVPFDACYTEKLKVLAVRGDGWLQVTDESGDGWVVNQARMIGFKVASVPVQAQR